MASWSGRECPGIEFIEYCRVFAANHTSGGWILHVTVCQWYPTWFPWRFLGQRLAGRTKRRENRCCTIGTVWYLHGLICKGSIRRRAAGTNPSGDHGAFGITDGSFDGRRYAIPLDQQPIIDDQCADDRRCDRDPHSVRNADADAVTRRAPGPPSES